MDLSDQRPDRAGAFPDLHSRAAHRLFPADGHSVGAADRSDAEDQRPPGSRLISLSTLWTVYPCPLPRCRRSHPATRSIPAPSMARLYGNGF